MVREAGFDTVRLPVKWSAHRSFERVDRAVEAALRRDLGVVLDVHHFDELSADPDGQAARFLALWSQIAEHYAGASDRLCFELLNEPHEPLTPERWNRLLADALAVVRASNPERAVIVGPVRWNIPAALPALRLPDDEHLIVTVHYYSPFRFTHQGAGWLEGAGEWLGTAWGTDAERARVRADLERAAAWARRPRPPPLPRRVRHHRHRGPRRSRRVDDARALGGRTARHRLGLLGLRHRLRGLRRSAGTPGGRPSGRRCSADYQRWCTCGAMRSP